MEEEISIAIKQKSISSLEKKLELLTNALQQVNARNTELQSIKPLQRFDIPQNDHLYVSNPQIIEENYRANTRYQKARQHLSNLQRANEQLALRIQKAQQLLHEEQERSKLRNLALLSPTAAQLLKKKNDFQTPTQNSSSFGQSLEINHLTEQIQAIQALKNGVLPKPLGILSVNFDQLIQQENSKLQRLTSEKDEISQQFVQLLQTYLQKSDEFETAAQSHEEYAQAFKRFQKAYNEATDNIESLPFSALLNILKVESSKTTVDNLDQVYDSLNKEYKVLEDRLEKMGVDDQESVDLKSEIRVQLLYLSHVTAIAEKALCKMSARKPPIDPLETYQIDIAEMEQFDMDK